MLFKRKKNKSISLVLCGEEYRLFSSVLRFEISTLESSINLNLKESEIYRVCKRYFIMCQFDAISNVLPITFEEFDRSDMLTLIVLLMVAADNEEDPELKAKYRNIAGRIQCVHRELGV